MSYLDPDGSGWVPYYESSTSMREVLLALYGARAVESKVGGGENVGDGKSGGGRERGWRRESE